MISHILFLDGTAGVLDIKEALFPNLPNFIAHIIATIIIVLFLSKFVYKPFKAFNEAQAEEINKLLNQATEKNTLANKTKAEAQHILDEAKTKSHDIIIQASIAADKHRSNEIEKVKNEIATLHINATKSIDMEREKLQQDIEKEIIQVAFEASKKIIGSKITEEENKKLVEQFLQSLD